MIIADNKLPTTLKNCPIVDAVVEVRFESDMFPQAVFGIVYEKLKHKYPVAENLAITQFPQAIIDADINLKSKPHYRLRGNGYGIQIGPTVVSIGPQLPYPGWNDSFFPTIEETLGIIYQTGIIKKVTRVGIRYTNFFESMDVFQKLNLKIQFNEDVISYKKTILRTELIVSDFSNTLQVSNDGIRQNEINGPILYGSIIDVDTFKDYNGNGIDMKSLLTDIQKGHEVEKLLFWNILNAELKEHLDPIF